MSTSNSPGSPATPPTISRSLSSSRKNDKQFRHRRKHKNSKLGCPNCKKRRVKCTEDLPSCSNCIKHSVKCGYLDYTEDQLEELRQSKLDNQFDNLTTDPRDAPSSPAPPQMRSSRSFDDKFRSYSSASAPDDAHPQAVTQVFDNLLNKAHTDETIIYPVYSLHSPHDAPAYPGAFPGSFGDMPAPGEYADPYGSSSYHPQPSLKGPVPSSTFAHPTSSGLSGAVHAPTTFSFAAKKNMNYRTELDRLLKENAASIANGTAPLVNIRNIYVTWLNSFVYRSYTTEIMFSCLVNLTTNYLISNCLSDYNPYRQPTATLTDPLAYNNRKYTKGEVTRLKNIAVAKSIKHYAKVIKELRILLNKNSDPELCSSVSYILSLMAIYDPEASSNSITCFRDGLFSILGYNISLSIKNNQPIPMLIPVHLRLMKNIVRSIYMPCYDPTFLNEYLATLNEFGAAVHSKIEYVRAYNRTHGLPSHETHDFIEIKILDLIEYVRETINMYLPTLSANMSNVDVQQEVLFEMVSKWVRLIPSKLTLVNQNTDPIEKVLYLFYKVWQKALYAILPQVKFFFLRDFDSPIMSDVFTHTKDTDIYFHDLDYPTKQSLPENLYRELLPQLKTTSAYLTRILTFLQMRLQILYRKIVYEEYSQSKFPIDDIKQWKETIVDIAETRRQFNKVIGMHEVHIMNFHTTVIRRCHYPTETGTGEHTPTSETHEGTESAQLGPDDLGEFLPSGLFQADYNINA